MSEPWEKKKKIGEFSFDLDQLEDLVDKIMKQMAPDLPQQGDKPIVFGFSMRVGEDGKPVIEGIGEAEKKIVEQKQLQGRAVSKVQDPLVDVQSSQKEVLVTVELPGVEKKDIKLNILDEHTLELIVAGQNSFYKRIVLPKPVKEQKAKAELKNGILEISLELLLEKHVKEIKID